MSDLDAKIENAFKDMFNKLDDKYYRKMQRDTHLCRAKCCDDLSMNMEMVQRCIDNCSVPINTSQEFLTRELESFKDRLVRCSLDCQDSIKDKIGANSNSSNISKHRMEYENCVSVCGDKILKLLPNMAKKIEEVAKEHQKHLDKMKA